MKLKLTLSTANYNAKINKIKSKVKASDFLMVGGVAVTELIRNHVAQLAITRHDTAQRLGAIPTQHYKAQAVREPVIKGNEVSIGIYIKGISRAYGDKHITPVNKRALTIPISNLSYGKTYTELKARGWKIFHPKGTDILATIRKGEKEMTPLYALKKHVRQPQDATLMPSDSEMLNAFDKGIRQALDALK